MQEALSSVYAADACLMMVAKRTERGECEELGGLWCILLYACFPNSSYRPVVVRNVERGVVAGVVLGTDDALPQGCRR